ncbi:MAG: hypothetical protein VYB44_14655 [Bacteroidota bacterium]|nr:hypothetical protein [Bacteroidota bacterium]
MRLFILGLFLLFSFTGQSQTPQSAFQHINLKSVQVLEPGRGNPQEVFMDDLIEFRFEKPDSLALREPQELFLYINGYRMTSFPAKYVTNNSVVFQIYEADTLRGLLSREINSWGVHEVKVRMSFGNSSGQHIHMDEANILIDFDPYFPIRSWVGRGIILLIIFVFFSLVRKNYFLKGINSTKYSLSRVQLAWWTMIVICCYIALWSDSGILVPLSGDTLILIGISAGTAAAAQTIDISKMRTLEQSGATAQAQTKEPIHKNQTFLFQVLSDENGINIQRFQSVVFTFFIGIFFVFEVITKFEMPDLDSGILGLMGISSATYAGLKTNEGKT